MTRLLINLSFGIAQLSDQQKPRFDRLQSQKFRNHGQTPWLWLQ